MANLTRGRSKIEKLGLSQEAIRVRGEGMGSIRSAKVLSNVSGEKINSTNVDNFFKSLKETTQDNKALTEAITKEVKSVNLKMLSNWDMMDKKLLEVLEKADMLEQKFLDEVDEKDNDSVKTETGVLKLIKDIVAEAAKLSEIRLRTLGQIQQGGKHITFNFIENQYNEIKQILLGAEGKFPGLNDYIEDKMMQGGKQE